MTAAAARCAAAPCCARRGGGLGDVSSSTRVRSETLVQRCVLVTVPPPFCCVCPRSVNQALLLSTRWMFGRVNRMVVIGRFGAFFGRRRLVADADTGWSSAARTDATGCMLQHSGDVRQSARVKLRVVSQRVRAMGHCL